MDAFVIIFFVGILSCVVLDLWQRILLLIFGFPTSNWALVGRWLIHFLRTRLWINDNLAQAREIKNELVIGWLFHYIVSIGYAVLFFVFWRVGIVELGLIAGLIFGVISVIVPWFIFMPAMGSGFLARKTGNPRLACSLAFFTHAIYGGAIGFLLDFFVNYFYVLD